MPFHGPRAAVVALASAIAFSVTGCGLTKTVQCNNLIDTINEGIALIEDFEKKSQDFESKTEKAKDPGTMVPIMNEFADLLETFTGELGTVTEDLDAIELKDETLIGFQQDYSSNLKELNGLFGQLTQALRDMGGVLDAISKTPRAQITPDKAKKWAADAQKAEADVAKVETNSKTATEAIDTIADDINDYCGREAPDAAEGE